MGLKAGVGLRIDSEERGFFDEVFRVSFHSESRSLYRYVKFGNEIENEDFYFCLLYYC